MVKSIQTLSTRRGNARERGGGGRTSREALSHMTQETSKRNKMAATGDDAAAMDSISRAPAAQPAAPNPAAGSSHDAKVTEAGLESPAAVPKRPNSNSEWWQPANATI